MPATLLYSSLAQHLNLFYHGPEEGYHGRTPLRWIRAQIGSLGHQRRTQSPSFQGMLMDKATNLPEGAVFLVKPFRAFVRADLPVYRAGQYQDKHAQLLQPLVSRHTTSRARS
jgi:hypothetical protein